MIIGLLSASAWTSRIGWADALARKQTIAATQRAMVIEPDNASYPAQLARLLAAEDALDDRVSRELSQAVSLNPHDAKAWIDLGLRSEGKGDYHSADDYLLRAAQVDRGFLPKWTLANYSFRRDEVAAFWSWATEAVAMLNDDPLPFFRLCGRVLEDGNLIDRVQIRNPELRADYLYYLLEQKRVDLVSPAVERVLENSRVVDVRVLFTACERLAIAGRVNAASDLWDRLAKSGTLSIGEARRTSEQILVNGRFTTTPCSRAFDWELPRANGISASREEGGQGIRVTFSGNQPEFVEALGQSVPVQSSTRYELRTTYRTRGVGPSSGLAWYVVDSSGAIVAVGPGLASEAGAEQRMRFRTPPESRLMRVSLVYLRAPGTIRLAGYIGIREVKLATIDQTPGAGSRVRK